MLNASPAAGSRVGIGQQQRCRDRPCAGKVACWWCCPEAAFFVYVCSTFVLKGKKIKIKPIANKKTGPRYAAREPGCGKQGRHVPTAAVT